MYKQRTSGGVYKGCPYLKYLSVNIALRSFPPVPVASTITPTPISSDLVATSASTIQVTAQPPFIGKLVICQLFDNRYFNYCLRLTKFLKSSSFTRLLSLWLADPASFPAKVVGVQGRKGRGKDARCLGDFVCPMADDYAIFKTEHSPVRFTNFEGKVVFPHPVCQEEAVFLQSNGLQHHYRIRHLDALFMPKNYRRNRL